MKGCYLIYGMQLCFRHESYLARIHIFCVHMLYLHFLPLSLSLSLIHTRTCANTNLEYVYNLTLLLLARLQALWIVTNAINKTFVRQIFHYIAIRTNWFIRRTTARFIGPIFNNICIIYKYVYKLRAREMFKCLNLFALKTNVLCPVERLILKPVEWLI